MFLIIQVYSRPLFLRNEPSVDFIQPDRTKCFSLSICLTMEGKSKTSSYSGDPPPSYAEAMQAEQLSPKQLTPMVVDEQCNNVLSTSVEAMAKQQRMKIYNKMGRWIIVSIILIVQVLIFLRMHYG